jgi:hypothetical protein
LWDFFAVVWSYYFMEKEAMCSRVTSCLNFSKEEHIFLLGELVFVVVKNPEVPTIIIHVQPMLEAIEGSGKA